MSKNLLEIFNRYTPDNASAQLLLSADAEGISLRVDKEQRMIEVSAPFPRTIPRKELYRIEEEIRKAYDLNSVRICPIYAANLFDISQIPDLLMETNRRGIVAKGFFDRCEYRLSAGVLDIEIPFTNAGINLIESAETPKLMEKLVFDTYGVAIKVKLQTLKGFDPNDFVAPLQSRIQEMSRDAARAEVQYRQEAQRAPEAFATEAEEEQEMLPRAASIYGEVPIPEYGEGTCRIGTSVFDISEPEYVYGEPFEIRPLPIGAIDKPQKNLTIIGEVFDVVREESRGGDRFDVSFAIFDGNASIEHRSYSLDIDQATELCDMLHNGDAVAMRGYAKHVTRKGKTDPDFTFYYTDIAKISKIKRKDTAEKKRVELHLHTMMSTMDALIPPDAAVKTAL